MESTQVSFAQVILPLVVGGDFTYEIPPALIGEIAVGKRVIVPFGRNKRYAGLVSEIHQNPPQSVKTKFVEEVLDTVPIIDKIHLDFWKWIASYYMCHLGEVMITALPSALKLQSETKVISNVILSDINATVLTDKEFLILEALELQKELSIFEIQQILNQKTVFPIINGLLRDGYVAIKEDLKDKYKPKTASFICLNEAYADEDSLREIMDNLTKAPKQLESLLAYYEICKGDFKKIKKKKIFGNQWVDNQFAAAGPATTATKVPINTYIATMLTP